MRFLTSAMSLPCRARSPSSSLIVNFTIALLTLPYSASAKSHKNHPSKITDPHDPHTHSPNQPPLPLTLTNRLLALLSNPPTTLSTFLLSLLLLAILTYLGQRSAAKVAYVFGWIYRRLQGDSAYEEGVKVPGFDSEDDDDGEVEYSVHSDVGKILDYVVTVDEKKKFGIQGSMGGGGGGGGKGGMRVRKVGRGAEGTA